MDIGLRSTSSAIDVTLEGVKNVYESHDVPPLDSVDRTISNDRFGFDVTIAPIAVVVRNTVDLLIAMAEPVAVMDPALLGPDDWVDGETIRIRRLRNRSLLTVEQAIAEYAGFFTKWGELTRSNDLDIAHLDEIQLSLPNLENGWTGDILVFVIGDFTYVVEILCIEGGLGNCGELRKSAESIRLSD